MTNYLIIIFISVCSVQADNDAKILKGADASIKEHPYMASFIRKFDRKLIGGAVIVSLHHLITSCSNVVNIIDDDSDVEFLNPKDPNEFISTAGSTHLTARDEYFQERDIERIDHFYACRFDTLLSLWEFDYGYIKLARPFEESLTCRPGRIYTTDPSKARQFVSAFKRLRKKINTCYTLGWGFTNYAVYKRLDTFSPRDAAVQLQIRALWFVDNCDEDMCEHNQTFCKTKLDLYFRVCFKAPYDEEGAMCENDYGAPLYCDGYVWGVGSWADKCGYKFNINIYVIYSQALTDIEQMVNYKSTKSAANLLTTTSLLSLEILTLLQLNLQ